MTTDANLWDDPDRAQKLMSERTGLSNQIKRVQDIESSINDSYEMIGLAETDNDEALLADAENTFSYMEKQMDELELESLLCQEGDKNDAFLEIHSGAGGTEAQDWASMLLRMYEHWADKNGYKSEIMELSDGEEAGIKSATLKISGLNAYGW